MLGHPHIRHFLGREQAAGQQQGQQGQGFLHVCHLLVASGQTFASILF
jgi:hypothetical protein